MEKNAITILILILLAVLALDILVFGQRRYIDFSRPASLNDNIIPDASDVYWLGSEDFPFAGLWVGSNSVHIGSVKITDANGCLQTNEFHAHGNAGVSGYYKFAHGTTPSAHKEAGHSILWVDGNEKLYIEKADGTDCQIIKDDGAGKVGIGVLHIKANVPGTVGSHPAGQLIIQDPDDSVFGNAVITGYESDGAGNPDQQLWYLGSSSSSNTDIEFRNRRNASLSLGTNDSTRMTIAANGRVSIGAASGNGKLSVTGTGADQKVAAFLGDDASHNRIGINGPIDADSQLSFCHSGSTCWTIGNNADNDAFIMRTGAGAFGTNDKFTILSDGKIDIPGVYTETDGSAANVFVASDGSLRRSTSSRKIKKDIVENVNPDWALRFKPVTFKAKADGSEHIGFIAEDMQNIDSRFATDGDLPGLELNAIVAALTATVQEQQKQIDELTKRIEALEEGD